MTCWYLCGTGIREALANASAPVVAVSPIVGGQAVKGPTAKIMGELGQRIGIATIADHYAGIIEGLVVDTLDGGATLDIAHATTDTLMTTLTDRIRVAQAAFDLADRLVPSTP